MPQSFSEYLKISDGLVRISYNSLYVASTIQHKVTVLSIENPEWNCKVDEGSTGLLSAVWAPDSYHFLTKTEFHLRISVWSISDVVVSYLKYPKSCPNNLAFSPGGRYLALLERREFHDHLSLFDCQDNWTMLRNIQLATEDAIGLLWSPDGRYLAIWDDCLRYRLVVHGIDGQQLCIYSAYCQERHLLGIKSVCWSPTGQLLAIGSYDQKCRLLNHVNWKCLACLSHPTDRPLDCRLGVSPSGKVIEELDSSLTTADSNRRLGNDRKTSLDVAPVRQLSLAARPRQFSIYQEERTENNRMVHAICTGWNDTVVIYRLVSEPISVVSIKPDLKLPFPKIGIGMMSFSPCGRFLVTRSDAAAHVAWIWSIDARLGLHTVLVHTSPITQFAWDPSSQTRLALCTGSICVFLWTPRNCVPVQLSAIDDEQTRRSTPQVTHRPTNERTTLPDCPNHSALASMLFPPHPKPPGSNSLKISGLSWLPSGRGLLLSSETEFCLCRLEEEVVAEDAANESDFGTGKRFVGIPGQRPLTTIGHLPETGPRVDSLGLEDLRLARTLPATPTSTSLPLGSFGASGKAGGDTPTGSHLGSVGDTPNWLRNHMPTDQLNERQTLLRHCHRKAVGKAGALGCGSVSKAVGAEARGATGAGLTAGGGQRFRQAWHTPVDDSRVAGGARRMENSPSR